MASCKQLRVASVGYINARPLVEGLHQHCDLSFEVPSDLVGRLRDGSADIALLPTIDLQREPNLVVLPVGGIGCDGPTLTVRLFSRVPLAEVTTLAVDPDSHTSVALSRIIFQKQYGFLPRYIDLRDAAADTPRLLIGDKVVLDEPKQFDHQLDLGGAWKQLTGLPFVFAVWVARVGVDLGDLPEQLASARERGMHRLPQIVTEHAVPRGWPAEVALRYYTEHLRFDIGPLQLEAIELFHDLAYTAGALATRPRGLVCR